MEHDHNPFWIGYAIGIFLILLGISLVGMSSSGINIQSFVTLMIFGVLISVAGWYMIGTTRKKKKTCKKCLEKT